MGKKQLYGFFERQTKEIRRDDLDMTKNRKTKQKLNFYRKQHKITP